MPQGQSLTVEEQDVIRAELGRILASDRFLNANRISGILRFVVEETLEGRRDRIKAFTIAQEVFGRDASFDQQRDPIVRVEASRLRKYLAEYYEHAGADSPLRIDIPKGGYAPAFTIQAASVELARKSPPKSSVLFGLACLAIVSVLLIGWWSTDQGAAPKSERPAVFLAVLPLSTSSDNIRAASLADSFVDSTITMLANLPDLSVMAHASMMEFNREQISIRFLKEEYGVTHVLRGGLDAHPDDLRIRVQLINTGTSETVWSDSLEGKLADVWELQDSLADSVLRALSIELEGVERAYILSRHTDSTEALMLYRQGLFMIIPPNEIKRVEAGRQLFHRVREIDPNFAGGYVGAAWSYALQVLFHNTLTPDEHLAQAVKLARQAIEIDPGFGAGHVVLGFTQALSGEKLKALKNARLAAAIQPGDAFVQFLKAFTLIVAGIPEESFAALDEAMRLNPLEKRAPYLNVYGIGRFATREYRLALDMFARNQARGGPQGPHMDIFRAAARAHLGETQEASAIIRQLNLDFPNYPYSAWMESWLGQGDHLALTLKLLANSGLDL